MRPFRLVTIVLIVACVAQVASAQARVVSAPPEPSLLALTGAWARASTLGDLRELSTASDHIELRVWGGFGVGATQGIVIRRAGGQWSAFLARVRRCEIRIPRAVGDTASGRTMAGYTAEARRRCGTPLDDVGPGARIITADTLVVGELALPDSLIERAWTSADAAGVTRLPGHVARSDASSSDFTYVVELRRGAEYRASQIEHWTGSEAEADRRVKAVYAAVGLLLPPELQVNPGSGRVIAPASAAFPPTSCGACSAS